MLLHEAIYKTASILGSYYRAAMMPVNGRVVVVVVGVKTAAVKEEPPAPRHDELPDPDTAFPVVDRTAWRAMLQPAVVEALKMAKASTDYSTMAANLDGRGSRRRPRRPRPKSRRETFGDSRCERGVITLGRR